MAAEFIVSSQGVCSPKESKGERLQAAILSVKRLNQSSDALVAEQAGEDAGAPGSSCGLGQSHRGDAVHHKLPSIFPDLIPQSCAAGRGIRLAVGLEASDRGSGKLRSVERVHPLLESGAARTDL
jgi:hypothetical protein